MKTKFHFIEKSLIKGIANTLFILLLACPALATHISGGDLTYKSLGNYQYRVTLVLYRDCSGIPVQNPELVRCVSASGSSTSFNVYLIPGTGNEITFPCFSTPTTCSGGPYPGYQRYEYQGTITLPPSSNWRLSWEDCCRNCSITTTQTNCSDSFIIDASLNNLLAPNDNSPVFTNYPVAFVCYNQNFTYNHGVVDQEGDSLAYAFISPRLSGGAPVVFNPGYSATNFLTSSTPITLSATTGNINFTPSDLSEIGITAIRIDAYRKGVKIGTVMRDIQFVVQECSPNILPTATGINGTDDFDTLVCSGADLCFEIYTHDQNPDQVLTVAWNNGIPGASFTTDNAAFPTATFCWKPSQADSRTQPYSFTIMVKDDNCAYNSYQIYSYQVYVPLVPLDSAIIHPLCDTSERGAIYLTEIGIAYPYNWLWANGETTSSRTGLLPGKYPVTVTNSIGCIATTEFVINPAPPKLMVSCLLSDSATSPFSSDGVLHALPTGGTPPYSYLWSNGSTEQINSGLTPGEYDIEVTDSNGCTANNTCTVVTRCPSISCSGTSRSCDNLSNGSATVSLIGDTTGAAVQWNHNPSWNTFTIYNLAPGLYTSVVTNNNGCIDSCEVAIPSTSCGGFRDYTQGGWGAPPAGKNIANYLKSKFKTVFPYGLTVGCTNKLKLTSWQAVVEFLPSGSTARALPFGTLINPGLSYSNVLAGQLVAVTLNVKFDSAFADFSSSSLLLGDLVVASGTFRGWTVKQVIVEANRALGDCGSIYSFSELTLVLDQINKNYDYNDLINSQYTNKCFLSCPVVGSKGSLRIIDPGTTDMTSDFQWSIYPNPAYTNITIQIESMFSGIINAELYSIGGKKITDILHVNTVSGELVEKSFNISGFAPGLYVIRIQGGAEIQFKRLIIIQ